MNISMPRLSDRLAQQLQADQQALTSQTQQLLRQHASDLQQLSSVALGTTKTDIQRQGQQMAQLLKAASQAERKHQQQLSQLRDQTLQRLRWLMLWPLLCSVLLSLLLVASSVAWSWWKLDHLNSQIQQITEQFCKTPAGQKTCKPM